MKGLLFFLFLAQTISIFGQRSNHEISPEQLQESFNLFKEMIAIPNDAHYPEDIEKNVIWLEKAFGKRGFTSKRLQTETVPLLLCEKRAADPSAQTVLFYMHGDGQPVDPQFWFQENPYNIQLKKQAEGGGFDDIDWSRLQTDNINLDWRFYGRAVSDAKGPIAMYITALDILASKKTKVDYNIKIIVDFEEEIGSPRIPQAVVDYKQDLEADMLVIFDGPRHSSNEPTLTFGARGIGTISLTLFGPLFPQHSGHYGNYAPNPAVRLAQLISSMKNDEGRVTIPGFYDGITIDKKTKEILAKVPDDENQINAKLGIAKADQGIADTYQEALQYPSLNIRGMSSGWVGNEARTIIPSAATAEIDIRLVLESDGERLIELVKQHIRDQGYFITDKKPSSRERAQHDRIIQFNSRKSYKAFRTDYDSQIGEWLTSAMTSAFGKEPIRVRTSGGSIPISPFVNTLDVPAVTVPTVNKDNNQHSPNENLRLGNYIEGIQTMIAILTEPIKESATSDEKLVYAAAKDYLDGLYGVDSTKIIRSVDPELTKLGMWYSDDEKAWYGPGLMTYDQLVSLSAKWNQNGDQADKDSPYDIQILDIESKTASAKVTAVWGIDYMQLVKRDGKWKILNILWQSMPDK